jgi:hypothetical protein
MTKARHLVTNSWLAYYMPFLSKLFIMKKSMSDLKAAAKAKIASANLATLNSEGYPSQVFNFCSLQKIGLSVASTKSRIASEMLTFGLAPENFSFTLGKVYDYAEIAVPVTGGFRDINEILPQGTLKTKRLFLDNHTLYFRAYSSTPIAGDDEFIRSTNAIARASFDQVQGNFDQYNSEVDKFNAELLPFIQELIEGQKTKLNLQKASESKLNPWA